MVNVFKHRFSNSTHFVQEATREGNFVCVSKTLMHVFDKRLGWDGLMWHVCITLYGPAWSEKDVERAERNSSYLEKHSSLDLVDDVARRKSIDVRKMFSLDIKP